MEGYDEVVAEHCNYCIVLSFLVSCFHSVRSVVYNQYWCNAITREIQNNVSRAETKCIALLKLVCVHVEQQACLLEKQC